MKVLSLTITLSLLATLAALAQAPARKSDTWGKSPVSALGDDRFSNPKKPLYAGPDGWSNTGEVRATVLNAARTPYKYTASFQLNGGAGAYYAVKELLVLSMDFGNKALPKPGTYKIGAKGSMAAKMVHFSFDDVSGGKLMGWSAEDGAGTLTVSLVNGYTYFTCRNVTFQPTGMSNKGEMAKLLTLGFEGALAPE